MFIKLTRYVSGLVFVLFWLCGSCESSYADIVPARAILPWRAQIEERINQQNRIIEILLQRLQQPQAAPQPIVIPGPIQPLPIGGEPKQILPIDGEPKQKLPIDGQPKQPLPIDGKPKQPLPPNGPPLQPLPVQPQVYTLFIRALHRR